MNRKQFALLLFLLVVLGIGGLIVYTRQNDVSHAGDPALGKKLLGDFPINDVAHITIQGQTNEVNLVKKDNLWRVSERDDYPANYSQISEALLKLRDLKVVQSEQVGPSQLPRLELAPGKCTNAAMVVDVKDAKDKPIRTLFLGKKHMQKSSRPSPYGDVGEGWPDGRYVKVGANSGTVELISDALTMLEPKPEQWLNKDFFKVDKIQSIGVESPQPTNSWKVTRDTATADWKLVDAKAGEQLDSSKTAGLGNALSSPTFSDVAPAAKASQFGLDKPTTVTLDTFDHFTYTLKVGQKTNDDYPLLMTVSADLPKERTPGKDEKAADKAKLDKEFQEQQKKLEDKLTQEQGYQKWVYLVSSWTLDPVLKERSQLLMEKKADAKKPEQTAANTTTTAKADPVKTLLPTALTGTNAPSH